MHPLKTPKKERPVVYTDADRLLFLVEHIGIDGFVGHKKDRYEYASEVAEANGREEPDKTDEIAGIRILLDEVMRAIY
jgi:hypothetical protein